MGKCSIKFNAALNVVKQLCAILFPLITFPYVSKVLGPFYYGKINFSASIISHISLIAELGITGYAIREGARLRDNKEEIQRISCEIFSINICSTVVAYIILILLMIFYPRLDGYEAILIIQSIGVLFTTIGTDWINSIYEDYLYITIKYVICSILSIVLMFIFVKEPGDYILYAIVCASVSVLANISNCYYVRKKYHIYPKFTPEMNIKRHLTPILQLFGFSIASLVYINSDITILGILEDEKEVGLYSVSAKIYTVGKQLFNAVMIVTIPRISNELAYGNKGKINEILSTLLNALLVLIIPAGVGLFMLSGDLINLLCGAEYLSAASSLKILSVALLFASVACLLINVIMIPFEMERKVLTVTVFTAVLNIVLNIVLIPHLGQDAAALTTLLSEIVMVTIGISCVTSVVSIKWLKPLIIGLANGLVTFVLCWLVKQINLPTVANIGVCIVTSVVVCLGIIVIADRQLITNMKHIKTEAHE